MTQDLAEKLRKRIHARRVTLAVEGVETDAFRLVDGAADGWPGLSVDCLGMVWLAQTCDVALDPLWLDAVEAGLCAELWHKQVTRDNKHAPACVAGEARESAVVSEGGARYLVRPGAGYSCGLFIDQRLNRERVRQAAAPGATWLNLFSYTCSFSVAAARSGAATTSVDLNGRYLNWGRENFRLNDLDPADHRWIKGDSFDWLAAFRKKGARFDGVVLDPPTFSRGLKKKVFRIETDLAELVALAAELVSPGGWLLVSGNTLRMSDAAFRAAVTQGLASVGRRADGLRSCLPMPGDFTGSRHLKSLWLTLP
jgi:23S rRNA (cytosine1962-C5)-methyltransferase